MTTEQRRPSAPAVRADRAGRPPVGARRAPVRPPRRRGAPPGRLLAGGCLRRRPGRRRRAPGGRRRGPARPTRAPRRREHPAAGGVVVDPGRHRRLARALPAPRGEHARLRRRLRGHATAVGPGPGAGGPGGGLPRRGRCPARLRRTDRALVPAGHAGPGTVAAVEHPHLCGRGRAGPGHVPAGGPRARPLPAAGAGRRLPERGRVAGDAEPGRVRRLRLRLPPGAHGVATCTSWSRWRRGPRSAWPPSSRRPMPVPFLGWRRCSSRPCSSRRSPRGRWRPSGEPRAPASSRARSWPVPSSPRWPCCTTRSACAPSPPAIRTGRSSGPPRSTSGVRPRWSASGPTGC